MIEHRSRSMTTGLQDMDYESKILHEIMVQAIVPRRMRPPLESASRDRWSGGIITLIMSLDGLSQSSTLDPQAEPMAEDENVSEAATDLNQIIPCWCKLLCLPLIYIFPLLVMCLSALIKCRWAREIMASNEI